MLPDQHWLQKAFCICNRQERAFHDSYGQEHLKNYQVNSLFDFTSKRFISETGKPKSKLLGTGLHGKPQGGGGMGLQGKLQG